MRDDELKIRIERLEHKVSLLEGFAVPALWRNIDALYDSILPTRVLSCIVCDYQSVPSGFEVLRDFCVFGGGKLDRYRCPQCECIFGPQKYLDLDDSVVEKDYQLLYSTYSEGDSTENEIRTFHSLRPSRTGLYLNWGCGGAWNRTVTTLRQGGWDVWGYEPGLEAPPNFVVRNRGEISAKFDGVFSNNVIEHFRKPVAQFEDLRSVLKPGGCMAHSSPCYEYSHAFTRFHVLFLLGRSPHILARRTGFRIANVVKEGEYINYVFEKI